MAENKARKSVKIVDPKDNKKKSVAAAAEGEGNEEGGDGGEEQATEEEAASPPPIPVPLLLPPSPLPDEYGQYIYKNVKKPQEIAAKNPPPTPPPPNPKPPNPPPPKPVLLVPKQPPPETRDPSPVNDFCFWKRWWKSFPSPESRRMVRDIIIWKLPVAKLFAVGCVPPFGRQLLLQAHKNKALQTPGRLKHNIEYFPSIVNMRTGCLWALHHPSHIWIKMPSLNFLPYNVRAMVAGSGGLLLLHGGVQSRLPHEEDNADNGTTSSSVYSPPPHGRDPKSVRPDKWLGEHPPQPLLVVCNPISRTFRVLPPLEMAIHKLVARITVSPLSDSYIIHLVGWFQTPAQNKQFGMMLPKVAVYSSIQRKWHFHPNNNNNNIFHQLSPPPLLPKESWRPDFSQLKSEFSYRTLPLVRNSSDGPVLYVQGETLDLLTNDPNEPQEQKNWIPNIMKYIFRKRLWTRDYWPLHETMEAPQLVECNEVVYLVSRTLAVPRTFHIFKLVDSDLNQTETFKGTMELLTVTVMEPDMYMHGFPEDHRSLVITTDYFCVAGLDRVWILCHTMPALVFFNVRKYVWEYMPSLPMFELGRTALGNWLYQPAIHAQV
jgi:hypothetical protein